MNKKIISSLVITLGLVFCGLNSLDTQATDIAAPSSEGAVYEEGLITELTPGNCVLEGDIGIPCPTACYGEDGAFQTCYYNKETGEYQNVPLEATLEEGLSGEPEVVCADPTEPGCEESPSKEVTPDTEDEAELEAETEEEPAAWPMILSFSALGATVVLVIIINLIGRKHKK